MFIGDIGINHNGSLDIAKKLIDISKDCGVDVVKFQKRNPDICIPEHLKYEVKDTIFGRMEYIKYKYMLEFGRKEYDEIDKYCKAIGIKWTASVWDTDSVEFMSKYDIPFIKIPSACITDIELLKDINMLNKDIIIGTGMSTEKEIDTAVKFIKSNLYGILHCNSSYPSKYNELDLNYIYELKNKFPNYKIGYSGHEKGYIPTIMAKTIGAEIIERHITLDNDMPGSDHKASLNPKDLHNIISVIKNIPEILGNNYKTVYESELIVKNKLRK